MIVVVGLDGTCCDAAWRRDMIELVGWDDYHGCCHRDEPIEAVRAVVNSLYRDGHITVALTSRPEKWRGVTIAWLLRNSFSFAALTMRPSRDFRSEADLKVAFVPPGTELAIDDSDAVVTALRAAGVACLQVGRP
jgi:beta-phosphoglucomutase-like phosphatase (HAD superfamily)